MSNILPINQMTLPSHNSQQPTENESNFWGDDGFTFGDLIDIINPLQHIPVISTIYRSITADEQSNGSKIVGGMVFGGVTGLLSSFFDAAIEQETGQDIASHATTALGNITTKQEDINQQLAHLNATNKYSELL